MTIRALSVPTAASAALALALCGAARADFNYPNFSSPANLTTVGTARVQESRVLLTDTARAQAGAIWHSAKQDVSLGFESTMVVRLQNVNGGGADGFAFVIQNASGTALGGTGGAIGYGRNLVYDQAGIANSLAVEFDTWNNNPMDWLDGASPHLSVQSRGQLENSPDSGASLGGTSLAGINMAVSHTLRIVYVPGVLRVYMDGAANPTLQVNVNLAGLLNLDTNGGATAGRAWVGITAATGALADAQTHVVESWSFTGTQIPAPTSAGLLGCGLVAGARRRRR